MASGSVGFSFSANVSNGAMNFRSLVTKALPVGLLYSHQMKSAASFCFSGEACALIAKKFSVPTLIDCFSSPVHARVDRQEFHIFGLDRVAVTPEIWPQAQLPFWTIADLPSANSAMESSTLLLPSSLGSVVELFR